EAGEVIKVNQAYVKAYLAQALSLLAQGKTDQALEMYRTMQGINARGASLAAMGFADAALYQGRSAEGIKLLENGIDGDLANNLNGPAAIKLAALAGVQRDRSKAVQAATRALASSKQNSVIFAAARVLLRNGQEAKALALASEMGQRLEPEPQAYAKLLQGEAELAHSKKVDAIKLFEEAQKLADTWLGRLDLGRAYLEAGAFTEASSELDACIKRRGEATAVYFDDVPSYRYFPEAYYYLGRAREGLKSPDGVESYKTFLAIKANADAGDPLVVDARK